jgi:hypothetical protein
LVQARPQEELSRPLVEAFFSCNPQLQPRRLAVQQESEPDYVDPMDFSFNACMNIFVTMPFFAAP